MDIRIFIFCTKFSPSLLISLKILKCFRSNSHVNVWFNILFYLNFSFFQISRNLFCFLLTRIFLAPWKINPTSNNNNETGKRKKQQQESHKPVKHIYTFIESKNKRGNKPKEKVVKDSIVFCFAVHIYGHSYFSCWWISDSFYYYHRRCYYRPRPIPYESNRA